MTIKSDDKVAQTAPVGNEKTEEQNKQEDQIPMSDAMAAMAQGLEKTLRAEIDSHPGMDAEKTFDSVVAFLESVAGAIHMAIDSFENIISSKDSTYPKGLLTPIFVKAYMEQGGNNCQVVRIPEELVEGLMGAVVPEVPKDVLH